MLSLGSDASCESSYIYCSFLDHVVLLRSKYRFSCYPWLDIDLGYNGELGHDVGIQMFSTLLGVFSTLWVLAFLRWNPDFSLNLGSISCCEDLNLACWYRI